MKLSPAFVVLCGILALATGEQQEFVGTNNMWVFGKSGVYVMSPNGDETHRHIPAEAICGEPEDGNKDNWRYCRFNDVVSDGKNYVWASVNRGEPTVDVFDINTGSIVGAFQSCAGPDDLEYHSLRDEVWVRCSEVDVNSTDPTHLDVLSASNPSGEVQTNILMKDRALKEGLSSSGHSIINNELGDVGYLTDSEQPYLFKIDLSTKDIIDKIKMSEPQPHGLYEAAFSKVNRHIYLRSEMCCTCGSEGADVESCGRSPGFPVSPSTGSSAGMKDVTGVCGHMCQGVQGVDSVGVYEFDTASDTVVATHLMGDGVAGDPIASPDGKHIVLLGKNGGKTVRVLEAGTQGSPSKVLVDLELGFNTEGFEKQSVARFVGFVERDGKTLMFMPSGTEHKVAIVDFTGPNHPTFETKIVTLTTKEFDRGRAPHGRYRRVEWAMGTNYVWTNDSSEREVYVIDVLQGKVVKTLTDMDVSLFRSVQNFHEEAMRANVLKEVQAAMQMQPQTGSSTEPAAVSLSASSASQEEGVDADNSLTVIAIVVGFLALAVGVANLGFIYHMKTKLSGAANEPPLAGVVPAQVVKTKDDEEVSVDQPSLVSVA